MELNDLSNFHLVVEMLFATDVKGRNNIQDVGLYVMFPTALTQNAGRIGAMLKKRLVVPPVTPLTDVAHRLHRQLGVGIEEALVHITHPEDSVGQSRSMCRADQVIDPLSVPHAILYLQYTTTATSETVAHTMMQLLSGSIRPGNGLPGSLPRSQSPAGKQQEPQTQNYRYALLHICLF